MTTEPVADTPARPSRAQRWTNLTAWPMFVLALVWFTASVALLTGDITDAWLSSLLASVVALTWIIFIVDYTIRFLLSRHRHVAFVRHSWFEALSLGLPFLRPFLIIVYIWRLPVWQRSSAALRARYVVVVVAFALVFVYTASTLVWLVEHNHPGANILTLADAVWWGFTTITTVGYGDYTPVTALGRLIAVGLMVGGIGVLGVTSATIISLLTDQMQRATARAEAERSAKEKAGVLPASFPVPALLHRDHRDHRGRHRHPSGHPPTDAPGDAPQDPDPPASDAPGSAPSKGGPP